jgi:hypothetical protein
MERVSARGHARDPKAIDSSDLEADYGEIDTQRKIKVGSHRHGESKQQGHRLSPRPCDTARQRLQLRAHAHVHDLPVHYPDSRLASTCTYAAEK